MWEKPWMKHTWWTWISTLRASCRVCNSILYLLHFFYVCYLQSLQPLFKITNSSSHCSCRDHKMFGIIMLVIKETYMLDKINYIRQKISQLSTGQKLSPDRFLSKMRFVLNWYQNFLSILWALLYKTLQISKKWGKKVFNLVKKTSKHLLHAQHHVKYSFLRTQSWTRPLLS